MKQMCKHSEKRKTVCSRCQTSTLRNGKNAEKKISTYDVGETEIFILSLCQTDNVSQKASCLVELLSAPKKPVPFLGLQKAKQRYYHSSSQNQCSIRGTLSGRFNLSFFFTYWSLRSSSGVMDLPYPSRSIFQNIAGLLPFNVRVARITKLNSDSVENFTVKFLSRLFHCYDSFNNAKLGFIKYTYQGRRLLICPSVILSTVQLNNSRSVRYFLIIKFVAEIPIYHIQFNRRNVFS